MNINDPIFFTIYIIACLAAMTIYGLFLEEFLELKYSKQYRLFYCIGFYIVVLIIMLCFYNNMAVRMLLTVGYLMFASFVFYKGTLIKRIIAGPLLFIVTGISDIITQFLICFIFQIEVLSTMPLDITIILLCIAHFLLYILSQLLLYYLQSHFHTSKSTIHIFLALTIDTFLFTIIISESLYFNQFISITPDHEGLNFSLLILAVCLLLSIFITIYLYHSLKTLKQSITNQIITQEIYNQYLYQLNQYLNMKNNEDNIKHLRHDIMNYVQTIHTYRTGEHQDEL